MYHFLNILKSSKNIALKGRGRKMKSKKTHCSTPAWRQLITFTDILKLVPFFQCISLSAKQLDYNKEEVQCLKPPYTTESFWGRNTSTSPLLCLGVDTAESVFALCNMSQLPLHSHWSYNYTANLCLLLMWPYHQPIDNFLTSSPNFWWAFPILPV